jgi:hypothetical protein
MTFSPDELLEQVRQSAEGFTVYGELGRNSDADIWYLARDQSTETLVALRLELQGQDAAGQPEYSLEVAKELGGQVAMGLGDCPNCKAPLRSYARFCGKCGADLVRGEELPTSPAEQAALLEQVRLAAADYYEVLGQMPWLGGAGVVYFALERESGRLVRLRLRRDQQDYSLGETQALMPLSRVEAGYATTAMRALEPPPSPPSSTPAGTASPPATPSSSRRSIRPLLLGGVGVLVLAVIVYLVFFSGS